jgi:hypothetical protein
MKTRRGASMIELLLIMSACTVVLTLTGVLLHRAMRIQMQSRAHVNAERTALRLSEQFRSDVHQARAVASDFGKNDKLFLHLDLADGRVAEYSRASGTLLRRESGGDRPTRREEFSFPGADAATIEHKNAPQRLALTIFLKPTEQLLADGKTLTSANFVPMSLCAEAAVGRDLRFSTVPANQEAPE